MHHALVLARRACGRVAPNPAVGCVIVSREGRVVGRGWTAAGGRPHAETIALAQAGEAARWITGEQARRFAHLLRAQHDAVLVGIGTVLADDPELTCRLPGLEDRSPARLILDTHLRLPLSSKLVQTARLVPTVVFTASE